MEFKTPSISLRDRLGVLLRDNRWVIAIEILLVMFLHVLPLQSRFILLLLFGWLSLWLRRSNWKNLGMGQPANWWRTISAGIVISILYQLFSISALVPILQRLTNTTLDLSLLESLPSNQANLALWLVVSWTIAAFGEEMAYRGYVLNRLADLFGKNQIGWGIAVIISSVFFGLGHFYQGVVGIVETFVFGIVAAGLYLASKRNLWLPILFHGMNDTIGFLLIFLGLYP
jgi:membrane protease YdiL (CAAX protease family)